MNDGYNIGFKELYELIIQQSNKLDLISAGLAKDIAHNTARIDVLEKTTKVLWDMLNNKKTNTWQVNLAIAAGLVSVLTSLAALIIK